VSRRKVLTHAQSQIVTGWTEVWTSTPDNGFAREGSVPLKQPRLVARFDNGRYRLRERKALVLPQEPVA
jgi:hypothetical protein